MNIDFVALIINVLKDFKEYQDAGISQDLRSDTPLFGRSGILDSIGLVSLVVAVEQATEDQFGVTISLADERAMSQTKSPYRTLGSLADYASHLVQEAVVS